jgi:hypothetical protein
MVDRFQINFVVNTFSRVSSAFLDGDFRIAPFFTSAAGHLPHSDFWDPAST